MPASATISEIAAHLGAEVHGLAPSADSLAIGRGAPVTEAGPGEFAFVGRKAVNGVELLSRTRASLLLVEQGVEVPSAAMQENGVAAWISVPNARLAFLRVLNGFFVPKFPLGFRHPSSVVDDDAEIHPDTYIGPFCQIGKCRLAAGVVLKGRITLYDGVEIGRDSWVDAGAVIGADGFGFERGADGALEKFPHTGGVVIGENVEIGANACIDRGTMVNTVIGDGSKIDNLVHIAHNVQIGRHCLVIAGASLSGRTQLGDRSWVGPDCIVKEGTIIGADAHLSLGCLVTINVPAGTTVLGKGLGYVVDRMTPLRRPPENPA
jgi:UDP-3-O-[3-hydroxymyristoyl] glucosamine N-acyltransferase